MILLVSAGQLSSEGSAVWQFYTNLIMLEFALGIVIYLVYQRVPHLLQAHPLGLGLAAIGVLILLQAIENMPWILVSAIPAALIIIAFLNYNPRKSYLVGLLVLFGNASYALYLSHPYVIQAVSKATARDISLFAHVLTGLLTALLCILISVLLYRHIELTTQRWLRARVAGPDQDRLAS